MHTYLHLTEVRYEIDNKLMVLNALICVLFAIKWFNFPFQIIKKTSYLLILGILPALTALDGTISTLIPWGTQRL